MIESTSSKSIGKNIVFSLIGTSITLLCGIFISIIVTQSLGPKEYGVYSLILWFRLTATLILDMGLSNAITKFWAELDGQGLRMLANRIVRNLFAIQVILAIIFGSLIAFFSKSIAAFLGNIQIEPYLPIAALALVLGIINTFLRSTLSGMQLFKLKSAVDITTTIINLVAVIIVLSNNMGIFGLLWMEVFLTLFQILLFSKSTFSRIRNWSNQAIQSELIRSMAKYCLGIFVFTTINALVTQRSETFFLAQFHKSEDIAFFTLAYNIGINVMNLVPVTIGMVILPALSNRHGAGAVESMYLIYRTTLKFVFLFSLPLFISGIFLSNHLISLLYGPAYFTSGIVLRILLPGSLFGSLLSPLLTVFWALGKPGKAIIWMLFSSLINILLAYLLILPYGAIGAAFSNSISQVIGISAGIIYLSKYQGFKPPIKSIARIALAALPVGGAIYFISFLFNATAAIIMSFFVGIIIYLFALLIFGAITNSDLDLIEEVIGIFPKIFSNILKQIILHTRRFLALTCFLLMFILLLQSPRIVYAANDIDVGCKHNYIDLNNDGKLDEVILTNCHYATNQDSINVYTRNGVIDAQKTWSDNIDFSDDLWVFDPGSTGQAALIIDFHHDGSTLVADMYDDQNGDGKVAYEMRGDQPVVTESKFPTVRVIGQDGWWTQGSKTSFNLDVLIDGKVRGDFEAAAYIGQLKPDGLVDFKIEIRDPGGSGRPQYDLRQAYAKASSVKTSLMVNPKGDEKPPVEGSIFWPYLGKPVDFTKRYGQSPAPIMVDWQAAKIISVSEFVASRGNDHNWFIYSIALFARGEGSYSDFETPFAFYDLASDQDGAPELAIRGEYYGKNDPAFLGGTFPQPIEAMRYSWDQDNNGYWDYSLALTGMNPINDEVALPAATVRTIPYDTYPDWVVQQKWDTAAFVADETGTYSSSEGIYEGYSRSLRDDYVTGQTSDNRQALADLHTVRVGQREEFNIQLSGQARLYISPIDGELHLYQASEGIWNLGNSKQILYKDLDRDGFIDSWSVEYSTLKFSQENDIVKSFVLAQDRLIYWDGARVRIRQGGPPGASALLAPPTDHASWQALGKQLQASRLGIDAQDLQAMMERWSGAEWSIAGAQLSEFRTEPGGFRFLLDLNAGGAVTGSGGPNLAGLAPGKYLVEYSQNNYHVQAVSPAKIQLELLADPQNTSPAFVPVALQIHITNPGLEDKTGLVLSVAAHNAGGDTNLLTQGVDLLAGSSVQQSAQWQPLRAGAWVLQAQLSAADGSLLGEAQASFTITSSELGGPASLSSATSSGSGLPFLGLLAAAALICSMAFLFSGSKGHN